MASSLPVSSRKRVAVLAFGSNTEGQLSVTSTLFDECVRIPCEIDTSALSSDQISRIVSNNNVSIAISITGAIYSCGFNDDKFLQRTGKKSIFRQIESLEAYSFTDASLGDNYVMLTTKDGQLLSWGQNDKGQQGTGDRINRIKPKLVNISEPIIQVATGSTHTCLLTRGGSVFTFGGNSKGQLGNANLASDSNPYLIPQLRHRPIIAISCGENFTMCLTSGGSVYSWGDNSAGQLGVGDTTHRLRPELIRSLKTTHIIKISTGRAHSCCLTFKGLILSFGSNSYGQIGQNLGDDMRHQPTPTVIERLREWNTHDMSCGAYHTICSATS